MMNTQHRHTEQLPASSSKKTKGWQLSEKWSAEHRLMDIVLACSNERVKEYKRKRG